MREVLRLPRFQHLPLQSAASATQDGGPQPRARQMLPLPRKRKPRCTKYCACHDFSTCISKVLRDGGPQPRARQHPSPLDSSQTLPLPRKRKPRYTKYCACHDFSTCISKVLRLPREMGAHSRARHNIPALQTAPKRCPCVANASPGARSTAPATTSALASPKCCACHARWGATAARATTSQPFKQLPNAASATQPQAVCE